MVYSQFIKKFSLPADFKAPKKLTFEDLIAHPLTNDDLEDDLAAVNSSIETIHETRGGSWPEGPLDKEIGFEDLAWHQREFRDGDSFAYAVYATDGAYIGCFYLYPLGVRTKLRETLLSYDGDASWWVTTEKYEEGYYQKLYIALEQWPVNDFPFEKIYYSNTEIPQGLKY